MAKVLPVPIEFRLPEGWLPARPEAFDADVAFAAVHPQQDAGFAANIVVDEEVAPDTATSEDLADESVERLREVAEAVTVTQRREVGDPDAPALTQQLTFATVIDGARRDLVQSQVYLPIANIDDGRRRVFVALTLTATTVQYDDVIKDFQAFVRTVRLDTGTGV